MIEATARIQCDRCQHAENVDLDSGMSADGFVELAAPIWQYDDDGDLLCEDCVEEAEHGAAA